MLTATDLFPPLGLTITAGSLQLRGLTDDDLSALGRLAQDGVHPPDQMPFGVPWTAAPAADLPRNVAQYHWGVRASFSPADFDLEFGVWEDGVLVGCQGLSARDFAVLRTGETGSWLGLAHHGRGIGTRMRQAVCAFAFDHLGARRITSGAWVDNPASLAVSRKVGYVTNGVGLKVRQGEPVEHVNLLLTPETFVRGEPIVVEGAQPVLALLGLDGVGA